VAAAQAVERINEVGGRVMGVVLNRMGASADGYYYYYSYYSHYYSRDGKGEKQEEKNGTRAWTRDWLMNGNGNREGTKGSERQKDPGRQEEKSRSRRTRKGTNT